jgi:hypothetical protein
MAAAEAAWSPDERSPEEAVTKTVEWMGKAATESVFTSRQARLGADLNDEVESARIEERVSQANLLRDIFGLFVLGPVTLEPAWLEWKDRTVSKLADIAYAERQLPSGCLDSSRLAVLGDALEEAGCADAEILGHLREQGRVHVRGCWVIVLLLNKE